MVEYNLKKKGIIDSIGEIPEELLITCRTDYETVLKKFKSSDNEKAGCFFGYRSPSLEETPTCPLYRMVELTESAIYFYIKSKDRIPEKDLDKEVTGSPSEEITKYLNQRINEFKS